MNSRILLAVLFLGFFAAFASAGCKDAMVDLNTAAISVDINWQTATGSVFGSMANGYVVPIDSTMIAKINGTYTIHCEDGANRQHVPPHRAIITKGLVGDQNWSGGGDQNLGGQNRTGGGVCLDNCPNQATGIRRLTDGNTTGLVPVDWNIVDQNQPGGSSTLIWQNGILRVFFPTNGSGGFWCDYNPPRPACPAFVCNGQVVYDGLTTPVPVYDFNEEGQYHVTVQYLKWAINPLNSAIPESDWVTDAEFNVSVFSPLLVIYGSKTTLLPMTPGKTTNAKIVWTIQNLSGVDMKINDINSPECARNGLNCGWTVNPTGLIIPSKKFVVVTQDINLENPPANYAPRDINLYIDVTYSDAAQGVMSFQKRSMPTLLKIKPVDEKKFSIKVTGQEINTCLGLENGQLKTGYFGKAAVPRIKLDWQWGNISRTECDRNFDPSGYYHYCDSVQFSTELLKRLERIDRINTGDTQGEPSSDPATELYLLKNFDAYLTEDGYSQDLINDFVLYSKTEPLLQQNNWYKENDGNFFKFFIDPSHFKILLALNADSLASAVQLNARGAAQTTLDSPGLYEVFIRILDNYDDNSLRKFILNGNINTDINVYLVKKTPPSLDSVFYYIPIDGKVGFVESPSGGSYDRQGYGSKYSGPMGDKNLLINAAGNPPTVGGTAANSILAIDILDNGTDSSDFSMMNQQERGGVLRITPLADPNSFSIKRYLSNATPVLLRIKQGKLLNGQTLPSNIADAFYFIKKNETPANPNGLPVDGLEGRMSYWTGIASNISSNGLCMDFEARLLSANFYSKPDANLLAYSGTECNPASGVERKRIFGYSWTMPQPSERNFVYAQTVFYTLKNSNYKIKPACDNKDNLIYAMPDRKILRTGEIALNYAPKYDVQNSVDVESLAGIFEGVEKGFVCLKNEGTKADFWWNEKKLYSQLDIIPQIDQNFRASLEFCKTPPAH